MSMRVFELAKELNIPTKELIKRIQDLGIHITGNFSSLSDDEITKVKSDFLEPSTRVEETEVPSQTGVKKVKRRIISAKKAKETKKIKASMKDEDTPQEKETAAKGKKKKAEEPETPEVAAAPEAEEKAPKRIIKRKPAAEETAETTKKAPLSEEDDLTKESVSESDETPKEEGKPESPKKKEKTEPRKAAKKKEDLDKEPERKKEKVEVKEKDKEKKGEAAPKKPAAEKDRKAKEPVKKKVQERKKPAPAEETLSDEEIAARKEPVKVTVRNKNGETAETVTGVTAGKEAEAADTDKKEDEKDDSKAKKKERKSEWVYEKERPVDEYDKKAIKSLQKKDKVKLDKKSYKHEIEEEDVPDEEIALGFEDEAIPPKPAKPSNRRKQSKSAKRREKAKKQAEAKKEKHVFNPRQKELVVGEFVTVGELAGIIGIKVPEIIKTLMSLGIMATITQSIDGETAALVASEHGVELKVQFESIEDTIDKAEDKESELEFRPPVVTIMGHVDHGKTSLLDKIRKTNVTDDEAGGITQHIGAYHVKTAEGKITFLDTPGHEAFTAMRARGADVTDIVILVVAADDGPRPQTVEAIHHAKAAGVAIIVAINKCDKPGANPDKTIQQLMEHQLISEEFGGDTPMIKVSAKTGDGIAKLLEMVHLQAEIMELKANPNRLANGVVIESKVDKGRGNTATILIQNGTLRVGDNYVVGTEYGRVRAMWNDRGKKITEATPAFPVEIVGLNGVPKAGDPFNVGQDEKQVRQIAVLRTEKEKERKQAQQQKWTLENLFDSIGKEEKSILNLIIKTDVNGSLDALSDALKRIGNEQVAINIIHGAVGAITSNDVLLATTSKAIIIGFNTRPDPVAKKLAQDENIEIRMYSVIYEAIEDVKKALEGMLKPIVREDIQGKAQVLEIFNIPKIGVIAGSKVVEGKIVRDCAIRVIRDNVIIHDGRLSSLQRFKDAAKEVQEGFECGIGIEAYKDLKVGDELESYLRLETAAKL